MLENKQFINGRVLEVGSLNINGSIRKFFDTDDYTGIDIVEGPDVDKVCKGHEFKSTKKFDVVCSTECFEHDEYYQKTLKNMVRLLKSGGLMFFTCGTTGRAEHGTRATGNEWGTSPDYYRNVTEEDVREVIDIEKTFSKFEFSVNDKTKDLYFKGIKK